MKRCLLLLVLMVHTYYVNAQIADSSVERMMSQHFPTCQDMYYNMLYLVPRLYDEHKYDSMRAVVKYFHKNCSLTQAVVTFEILTAIYERNFREDLVDVYYDSVLGNEETHVARYKESIVAYLVDYRNSFTRNEKTMNAPYYAFTLKRDYNKFISEYAKSLMERNDLKPIEQFLVRYYADPLAYPIERLRDSIYKGTITQQAFIEVEKFGGFSYGLVGGVWHPTGNLSIVGNHPYLGLYIGGRSGGTSFDLALNVAFVNSPNYFYSFRDSLTRTKNFTEIYIGLDVGQAFYRTKKTELGMILGVAYDGMTVIPSNSENNQSNAKVLKSFNVNGGCSFKWYYKHVRTDDNVRHAFVGLQARYHLVNYDNGSGTDMSGDYFTFGLVWGGFAKSVHKYYGGN